MDGNSVIKRLEKVYRKLSVKFPYPQILWDKIFYEPNDLVEAFKERASQTGIGVEVFRSMDKLEHRLKDIFATYGRVWVCNRLRDYILGNEILDSKSVVNNQWDADVGISLCRALIARTGSIILDSSLSRQAGLITPQHFVIATKKQIYPDLHNYFEAVSQEETLPSSISIISGPSRTADIEKKLVKGAHGPASVTVLLML
ncbi:MAG: hypothetical protein GXO48_01505 [Chlorobi bacterium]|nr:hypothetical protein [Chlorobiota bacterium]